MPRQPQQTPRNGWEIIEDRNNPIHHIQSATYSRTIELTRRQEETLRSLQITQRRNTANIGPRETLPSEIQIPEYYDIGNVRAVCWGIETGLSGDDLYPFLDNLKATFQELEIVMEIYKQYNAVLTNERRMEIKIAFSKYSEKTNIKPKKSLCFSCQKPFIYWNLISKKVILDGYTNMKNVEMCSDCYRKKNRYVVACSRHMGNLYLGKKKVVCPLYPNKCKIINSCPSAQCLNEHAEKIHKGYHTRRWKASKRFYSGQEGKIITSNLLTGIEFEVVGKNKECMRTNLYKLGKMVGLDHDHSIESFYLNTEVVTPPASGRKLEEVVSKTSQALAKDGFTVNDRCGLHIHIDLFNKFGHININPDFYKSLLGEYILWEQIFYRLVPQSRSGNPNIKSIGDKYMAYYLRPENVSSRKFSKIWYGTDDDKEVTQLRNQKRHKSKYYWANFHSLLRKEGLEIRIMEGTTDANSVLWWTRFNHDFINKAAEDQKSYLQFKNRRLVLDSSSQSHVFEIFIKWLSPKPDLEKFLRGRAAMHKASTSNGLSGTSDRQFIDMIQNMTQFNTTRPSDNQLEDETEGIIR